LVSIFSEAIMLVIRKEQMDTLGEQMRQRYEDRLVVYLNQVFPDRCAQMGEPALRKEIRYGMASAAKYNITTERDVAKYIELMFRHGRDFDTSPDTPWAQPILTDPSSTADNRLRRVAFAASKHQRPRQRPHI
jgi:hypothetical protein